VSHAPRPGAVSHPENKFPVELRRAFAEGEACPFAAREGAKH
jgi:hypothetical protein